MEVPPVETGGNESTKSTCVDWGGRRASKGWVLKRVQHDMVDVLSLRRATSFDTLRYSASYNVVGPYLKLYLGS